MSITTYATLQTAIEDYLDDTTLDSTLMIQLAEKMFNRRLFTFDQLGLTSLTATAGVAYLSSLPSDFAGIQSIYLGDYAPLQELGIDDFQKLYAEDTNTGVPKHYMLANGLIYVGPTPEATLNAYLHYWKKLAPLTDDAPSNWLLAAHPDLYLFASLMQAELFGWNDERLPLLKAAVEGTINEIHAADSRIRANALSGTVSADYF